jgi:hypothetical protein
MGIRSPAYTQRVRREARKLLRSSRGNISYAWPSDPLSLRSFQVSRRPTVQPIIPDRPGFGVNASNPLGIDRFPESLLRALPCRGFHLPRHRPIGIDILAVLDLLHGQFNREFVSLWIEVPETVGGRRTLRPESHLPVSTTTNKPTNWRRQIESR